MKRILRKGNTDKGFTLAELLIVVAIIGVLVAIAIPTFSSSLDKSRAATEKANARSTYAEAAAQYLDDSTVISAKVYDGVTYTPATSDSGETWTITLTDKKSNSGATSYTFPESSD